MSVIGVTSEEFETEQFVASYTSMARELAQDFADDVEGPLSARAMAIRRRIAVQVLADLQMLRRQAVAGTAYGDGVRTGSAWKYPVSDRHGRIGELKHPNDGPDGAHRVVDVMGWQYRLYFSRPDVRPGLMLWLQAGRKPVDGDWRTIQSAHIELAKAALNTWYVAQAGPSGAGRG